MKRASVFGILSASGSFPIVQWDEMVELHCWVKNFRDSKNVSFIVIYDGSVFGTLQAVVEKDICTVDVLDLGISSGTAVKIIGRPVKSKGREQEVDFVISEMEVIGECDSKEYPIQPKKHSMEFFREHPHLRVRATLFQSIFRIRHRLAIATHEFFDQGKFIYVHTPIITGNDCEGAGEMFRVTTLPIDHKPEVKERVKKNMTVAGEQKENHHYYKEVYDHSKDFFGQEVGLTVSGQLEAEAAALGLGRVYTFGPTFRAENSNTSRHLSEFWMIEPEIAFADLEYNMAIAEGYLRAVLKDLLAKCYDELEYLQKYIEEEEKGIKQELRSEPLIDKIVAVVKDDFARVTYTEAFEILRNSKPAKKGKFEYPVEKWGMDFQSEHERYLVEKHFKRPVIVTDYPKEIKSFYMRDNDDGKTVAAMDILFPGIGEIVGGSQREERLEVLKEKMTTFEISHEEMSWYLDTRRFGTAPHAGFGVGFERLVQFATGMKNIRDVVLYPRSPGALL